MVILGEKRGKLYPSEELFLDKGGNERYG